MSIRSTSLGEELSLQTTFARCPLRLSTFPSDQEFPDQRATTWSPTAGGVAAAAFSEAGASALLTFAASSPLFAPIPQAVNSSAETVSSRNLFMLRILLSKGVCARRREADLLSDLVVPA